MIEIGKKIWRGSRAAAPRIRVWSGVFPSPVRVGSGRGHSPLRRKCLRFLPENGAFCCIFFAIREISSQFKGGAWPKWPNGKYATA